MHAVGKTYAATFTNQASVVPVLKIEKTTYQQNFGVNSGKVAADTIV
jgi:hypothetical protein